MAFLTINGTAYRVVTDNPESKPVIRGSVSLAYDGTPLSSVEYIGEGWELQVEMPRADVPAFLIAITGVPVVGGDIVGGVDTDATILYKGSRNYIDYQEAGPVHLAVLSLALSWKTA